MINRNPPPGVQVLVRSNEDSPFMTGYFYRFLDDEKKVPMVVIHFNGMPMLCSGVVVEDGCELRKVLNKMTSKEQWDYLSSEE